MLSSLCKSPLIASSASVLDRWACTAMYTASNLLTWAWSNTRCCGFSKSKNCPYPQSLLPNKSITCIFCPRFLPLLVANVILCIKIIEFGKSAEKKHGE